MLTPHPNAAVEYWYFKVNTFTANTGPAALLVDWIERRRVKEKVIRASVHSPAGRDVLFAPYTDLTVGENTLTMQHTRGSVGSVEWDMQITAAPDHFVATIFPAAQLKVFDLTLESAPVVEFTGWFRHGSQRFEVDRALGTVTQYWGRQLAREWWWFSATQFDTPCLAVEAGMNDSAVWGTSLHTRLGYLYLRRGEGQGRLWIAPPAAMSITGTLESVTLEFRPPGGKPIRLVGRGCDFGDFGERITNTSVGDLEVYEGDRLLGIALGTAGLEHRQPG